MRFRDTKYIITDFGRVINIKTNRVMKQHITTKGYAKVGLSHNAKKFGMTIHRMVAECYVPNPDNKPEINHKDGNKLNNHYKNLEWCTRKENEAHAKKMGLRANGQKHGRAKLTDSNVLDIRVDLSYGVTRASLARKYNVDWTLIDQIKKGVIWKHLL